MENLYPGPEAEKYNGLLKTMRATKFPKLLLMSNKKLLIFLSLTLFLPHV